MSSQLIYCISLILLLMGSAMAMDVPFIFDENSSGVAGCTSDQLEKTSKASIDLAGVPPIYKPSDNEILEFPITGGNGVPAGKKEEKAKVITEMLNVRVEPDNPRVLKEARALALKSPGDLTIDQICSIYSYLKFGADSKKGWGYVHDVRGLNYFNYANESLSAGDLANRVGGGDCDDFAILMSALVESIGGTTRIILANNNSTGGHAYAEVYLGRLDVPDDQVIEIINWLQDNYDADGIYGHIDTKTKEAWLNLDWGPDESGNAYPGGPLFQGEEHYVLCIRDMFGKNPLRCPAIPNKLPRLINLTSDKTSHQEAGAIVTWTAKANDPEDDRILYRFFLNDDAMTKWINDNKWVWKTTDNDIGDNQIKVVVRDGKHAGMDSFDGNKVASFSIEEPKLKPPIRENQLPVLASMISDRSSPQDAEAIITWTAKASDTENDSLFYRFLLRGKTVSDWSSASQLDMDHHIR